MARDDARKTASLLVLQTAITGSEAPLEMVADYNVSAGASFRHDLTGMNGGGRSPHQ